jgi:hypothetical protein
VFLRIRGIGLFRWGGAQGPGRVGGVGDVDGRPEGDGASGHDAGNAGLADETLWLGFACAWTVTPRILPSLAAAGRRHSPGLAPWTTTAYASTPVTSATL